MRIPDPVPDTLSEATQLVLQEARLELGETPRIMTALAHAPAVVAGLWALLRGSLLEGAVPRTTKELIALAATSRAKVIPLRDALRSSLAARGLDAEVLDDLVQNGETHRLPERTQQIVFVGRRAALQAAMLTDADFSKLRKAGLGDPELAELVALAGTIAALIAISRALGGTA